MKLAIIRSRSLTVTDIGRYLPSGISEIVSGGAKGIDRIAREYAENNGISLTEFLPDYTRYGKGAPLRRNLQIINYADEVVAFWDGVSNGTRYTIEQCRRADKKVTVHIISGQADK